MNFSLALQALKEGKRIYRIGWNGKKQYLQLVSVVYYEQQSPVGPETIASHLPAIAFYGTAGVQIGWLASQADLLAEDWAIKEEE